MSTKIILLTSSLFLLILFGCSETKDKKLDPDTYEIVKIEHNKLLDVYYVIVKVDSFNEKSLTDFAINFTEDNCSRRCNINLFDSNSIESLMGKYPLSDSEYIEYADHFIGKLEFEVSEIWFYPFQDIKYKELGGKNWKNNFENYK